MAIIDIRAETSEVAAIIWADSTINSGRMIIRPGEHFPNRLIIEDEQEECGCEFDVEDIDNLIKALQKAKELWVKE